MGVSIYYKACRPRSLTLAERATVNAVVAQHPVGALIAECGVAESEFDGEAFCVYPEDESTEPGVVFEGATKLPLCSMDATWTAIRYWCRLLSEVRRELSGSDWRVHVDDHDVAWIEEFRTFDPSA